MAVRRRQRQATSRGVPITKCWAMRYPEDIGKPNSETSIQYNDPPAVAERLAALARRSSSPEPERTDTPPASPPPEAVLIKRVPPKRAEGDQLQRLSGQKRLIREVLDGQEDKGDEPPPKRRRPASPQKD
ncbi:unnamed protein product [Peniophora sp. CBMAI 1063]|nr:unnamed protein product [Peniophora sp. CBMAI 1063]